MELQGRLNEAFASLTDSLVTEFDVAELLTRVAEYCVSLCSAGGAGIVVLDTNGALRDVAYSSDAVRRLETFQTHVGEGPCVDCVRSGRRVVSSDLAADTARWPVFAPEAVRAGFASVRALPLRLGTSTVGALNLFDLTVGDASDEDLRRAQTLADIAVIALLQQGVAGAPWHAKQSVSRTLQARSVIERAKGVLAEHGSLDMDEAYSRLRRYAATSGDSLTDIAERLVDGQLAVRRILAG